LEPLLLLARFHLSVCSTQNSLFAIAHGVLTAAHAYALLYPPPAAQSNAARGEGMDYCLF